ncbi:hypothetical protein K1719_047293 [Acacia pycnantha]|nr:hypothetical protein K1719_047293 [Acacia pycnantha]
MGEEDCCATQLIGGDACSIFFGLGSFHEESEGRHCGLSYAVVAIMGPRVVVSGECSDTGVNLKLNIGEINDNLTDSASLSLLFLDFRPPRSSTNATVPPSVSASSLPKIIHFIGTRSLSVFFTLVPPPSAFLGHHPT